MATQDEPKLIAAADTSTSAGGKSPTAVIMMLGTVAGLVAGLAAAGLYKLVDDAIELSPELAAINGMSSKAKQDEQAVALEKNNRIETIAQGGLFGFLCGACLGLVGMKCGCGTSRVTPAAMALGAVAAALLGAVGAVVGAGFPDHWGVRETSENLLKEASVRGLMMVLAGAGAGLMFGSTIKSRVTSVVFGVVGGALAAGLCPILISTLFPDVRSEQFLVSNLPVNLCLLGTTGLLIGLFTSIARSQPQ